MMELYLFVALFLIYALTSLMADKFVMRRVWMGAFWFLLLSPRCRSAFAFYQPGSDDECDRTELVLYFVSFASLMVVLGLINIWMFRRQIWNVLFTRTPDAEADDDDDDDVTAKNTVRSS